MKHHFGLTKQGGQPSCCFDLCVTPFSALISAIEDDFAHFFDLLIVDGTNAEGDRSKAGEGGRNIANAYGMTFNHEGSTHSHLFAEGKNDDEFYIRDDFAKFRQRYAARVQNFRDAMQCPVVTLVALVRENTLSRNRPSCSSWCNASTLQRNSQFSPFR